MRWLKKRWIRLKFLIGRIVAKFNFGSKNRPYPKVVIDFDLETKKPVGDPYFVILNSKGETLNSPLFSSQKEAEAWIDNYLAQQNDTNIPDLN